MEIGEILLTCKTQNRKIAENAKTAKRKENHVFTRAAERARRTVKLYKTTALVRDEPVDLYGEDVFGEVPDDFPAEVRTQRLAGMSGAAFPLTDKLNAVLRSGAKRKILLVNAAECDPGLLHDSWLLAHRADIITAGIAAVKAAVQADRAVLAAKFPVTITGAETAAVDAEYPLGEEHFLIRRVLGISLDKNAVPAEQGILVMNLQTVFSAGLAARGAVVRGRYLTAADLTTGKARIVRAAYGTSAAEVLRKAFGKKDLPAYAGSGVMNACRLAEDALISPETNFLAYAAPVRFRDPSACTGCGACNKKCPARLPVTGILNLGKNTAPAPDGMVYGCVFCRACTYVCPESIDVFGLILKKMG